jgi:hypothetical protein
MKLSVPSDPGAAVLDDEAAVVAVAPAAAVVAVALELLELLELFELELHASSSADPPIPSAAMPVRLRIPELRNVRRSIGYATWPPGLGRGLLPSAVGEGYVLPVTAVLLLHEEAVALLLVHRDPLGPAGIRKR